MQWTLTPPHTFNSQSDFVTFASSFLFCSFEVFLKLIPDIYLAWVVIMSSSLQRPELGSTYFGGGKTLSLYCYF